MIFKPKSKTQEYRDDGNKRIYRCYSPNNPHYYEDITGSLHAIDLSYSQSFNNEKVGNFVLKSKNIQSLGIRSGSNNTYKYMGLRPDNTQESGSQQYEWTIVSASVNNENIPIDLSKYSIIDNNKVDLGNVVIDSNRQFTRQMFQYTSSIDDFNIEYKLHLTGLHISNSKYTETTTVRNSISESIIDCGNISGSQYSSMTELQTSSESILSVYFTDDAFLKNINFDPNPYYNYNNTGFHMQSGSEFKVDTGSFYFINRDTEFWGEDSSFDMFSSAYFKDNILLKFKDISLATRIKDYILDLTNSELDNNYIRVKGGKKIGAFAYPPNQSMALLGLSLKDITYMSSSFRYKKFDDWSHITMSYSDIVSGIRTQLNDYNSITASTDYYRPNAENQYIVNDSDGDYKYSISSPVLLDSEFEEVTNDTNHTLKDNGDGTYEYIKYPSKNLLITGISKSVNYIDANTTHTLYPAGDVYITNSPKISSFSSARNDSTVSVTGGSLIKLQHSNTQLKGADGFYCSRGFIMFDIASISTTSVLSGKLTVTSNGSIGNMTPSSTVGSHLITICSSSAGSSVSTSEGQAFDRNVPYMVDDYHGVLGRGVYFNSGSNDTTDITLNAAALTQIQDSDAFDVSIQEGSADFKGTYWTSGYTGGSNTYTFGFSVYSSDQTGTSKDPYLEFIVGGALTLLTLKSGTLKISGGKLIIK